MHSSTASFRTRVRPRFLSMILSMFLLVALAIGVACESQTNDEERIQRSDIPAPCEQAPAVEAAAIDLAAIDLSPDGRYVVLARLDGSARVTDRKSGKELTVLWQPVDAATLKYSALSSDPRFVFSPDGRRLASCRRTSAIRVWRTPEFGEPMILELPFSSVPHTLTFSPDSRFLAMTAWKHKASGPNTLAAWELETGRLLASEQLEKREFRRVEFSDDGIVLSAETANRDGGESAPRSWRME